MTPWKIATAYFIPAVILVLLLCGHFFSHLGLLEKWFLEDHEIRQFVSSPPVLVPTRGGNLLEAVDTASKWPQEEPESPAQNGFDNSEDTVAQSRYANAYEDSRKTSHRRARAYFNLALACNKSGRVEEAIQAYQQALVHKRDFPHAWLNLGTLHYRRQDWQKAREAFKAASLLDSTYAKAHFNLSLTYGKLGELDKAAQAARRVLAFNNRNAAAYNLLGLIHTLQGDYEAAVSVYKQGLAVDARDAELISNLSLTYQKMNQTNQAEENL